MGLRDLMQRWTRSRDADAVAKAQAESRLTPAERTLDSEDYEARKDDIVIQQDFASAEAVDVANAELED